MPVLYYSVNSDSCDSDSSFPSGFTPPILAPQAQFDIGVEAAAVGMVTSLIYLSSVLATLLSSQILNKMGAIRVSQLCILLTSLGMLLMTIPNYF